MSAPYANQLTAAPTGPLFAWVEDAEGRHNLYVGGKDVPARALTHNTEDDGQDIRQLAWSPDATAIAYTYGAESGADGKPANPAHLQRPTPVEVRIQPLAPVQQEFDLGEGRSPLFTRDGRFILFVRSGQIWIADRQNVITQPDPCKANDDGMISQCTAFVADPKMRSYQLVFDRGSASALTLSPDGKMLAFISRRHEVNQPSHSYLALYSLTTHTLSFPAPSTGDDSAPAFSPDGKYLAWLRAPFTDTAEFALNRVSANPWSIQVLDVAAGKTRTVYSPEPNKPGSVLPIPDDSEPYLLWAESERIVFFSEVDGWDHLYSLDINDASQPRLLTPGDFEVESPIVSANGTRLYFSANGPTRLMSTTPMAKSGKREWTDLPIYAERRSLFAVDLTQASPVAEQLEICCKIDTRPQIAADGTVADLVSDAWTPVQPQIVDVDHGSWQTGRMHTPLHPDSARDLRIQSSGLTVPDLVIFPSTDSLRIHGQLFLPSHRDHKNPAIIFMHGGPRRQMLLGYPSMEYYSNAYAMNQYLTSRGFIVLSVNYRCGIGYGLDFRQCDHEGATGAAEYNDILAAAKYLQSRPDVDAKRIGLWGGSYGGYLTALGLARNSDIFAAGVDFHGVHDWNLEDNAGDWKRGSNAEQDAIAAEALKSSPLGDISHWHSPILLIHGDNDPSVAYAQTPRLADALRARNASLPKDQQVDVEELIFPDEVHEFLLHKDWVAAYTAAAAFFERTLKP